MNKLLSYFLILCIPAVLGEFPDGITRCHSGDNACLKQSIQAVLKNYPGGLRELNLIPFELLRVKSLALEKNPSSPVNLELKFRDVELIGLNKAHVKEAKGFTFNGNGVLEVLVPELILKGKYIADGRVLILPITGKGNCVITTKNVLLRFTFNLKPVEKNGQVFSQLEHVKLQIKPEHLQLQFDNLFNGDKTLSDNMNKFLNENWRDIFNELEDGVATALGLVTKQLINNVLSKHPYDVLFPKHV